MCLCNLFQPLPLNKIATKNLQHFPRNIKNVALLFNSGFDIIFSLPYKALNKCIVLRTY